MGAEVTVVFLDQDCDDSWAEAYEEWLREMLEERGGITVIAVDIEEV